MDRKRRNISVLEYFNALQVEYFLYELRLKIYPFSDEKKRFKEILAYKTRKIIDIAEKNNLNHIFNSTDKYNEIFLTFYTEFGIPRNLSNKDRYFYFTVGSDFSFCGSNYTLIRYDFSKDLAVLSFGDKEQNAHIQSIKRIL